MLGHINPWGSGMADALRVPPPSALSWLLAAENQMRRDRLSSSVSTEEEGLTLPTVNADKSAQKLSTVSDGESKAAALKFGMSQILAKPSLSSPTSESQPSPTGNNNCISAYKNMTNLPIFCIVFEPFTIL